VTRPGVAEQRGLKRNKLADFELVLGHSDEPFSLVHRLFDLKLVLGHNESAFLFRLIASHVAELMRSFDEAALPVRAFLNGCSLIAERVNCSPGQLPRPYVCLQLSRASTPQR
jgi:hypothetical protein